jgi:hypothetical protein
MSAARIRYRRRGEKRVMSAALQAGRKEFGQPELP